MKLQSDDDSLWSKFVRRFNRRDVGNPFAKLYNDIMFNIFGRLPADTLLACKLVSPCWYVRIVMKENVEGKREKVILLKFYVISSPSINYYRRVFIEELVATN